MHYKVACVVIVKFKISIRYFF